jgi:hypothetical protein
MQHQDPDATDAPEPQVGKAAVDTCTDTVAAMFLGEWRGLRVCDGTRHAWGLTARSFRFLCRR